jgi:hypothetical protein
MSMKSVINYLRDALRHPFKSFQRRLNIENEWTHFKTIVWRYKYQSLTLGAIVFFPVLSYAGHEIQGILDYHLRRGSPISKSADAFLKQTLDNTVKDPHIQREASLFVERTFREQVVINAVLEVLLQSVKDEKFKNEGKVFGRQIADDLLHSKKVQDDVAQMMTRVIQEPDFKMEVLELVKWTFSQPETEAALASVVTNSFQDQHLRDTLQTALGDAMKKIFLDKEIVEQTWDSLYFLLEDHLRQSQGKRSAVVGLMTDKKLQGKMDLENPEQSFMRMLGDAAERRAAKMAANASDGSGGKGSL